MKGGDPAEGNPIGADDTLGTVYFDRLFRWAFRPCSRRRTWWLPESIASESRTSPGSYEGWCRKAEARINWANMRLRLQRGARLQPRAGRLDYAGRERITDLRRPQASGAHFRCGQGQDRRNSRSVDKSFQVSAQGGRIEVLRAKLGDARTGRAELVSSGRDQAGAILGN